MRFRLPAALVLVLLMATGAGAQDTQVTARFQPIRARKAEPLWSWAACVQMCLNADGAKATQKEILDQSDLLSGEPPALADLPGSLTYEQGRSGRFAVTTRYTPKPLKRIDILDAFQRNRMIVASIGDENPWNVPARLVVVYGYRLDLLNGMHLTIYDPTPPGQTLPEVDLQDDWGWRQSLLLWADSDSTDEDTYYKDPPQCINLAHSDVQWGPSLNNGTLYYSLTYENVCDRPVRCSVTIQSGNEVEGFALAGTAKWVMSQSRTQVFVLMPGASYTVRGGLRWRRTDRTTPRILYPSPNRGENMNLIRCDYLNRAAD